VSRPAVEVADILHAQGDTFLEQHPWLSVQQRTVLRAIARCRTAALGGHLDRCDACGHQAISYNSCRNRHCPKCQAQARERELLDVPYVHVVFTLPHALLPLTYRNGPRLYTWLFQTSAGTLREVAADPRHEQRLAIERPMTGHVRHVPMDPDQLERQSHTPRRRRRCWKYELQLVKPILDHTHAPNPPTPSSEP